MERIPRDEKMTGHELEAGAGELLQIGAGDVRRAAGTGGARQCLVRIGLQPRDQFAQIFRRESILRDNELWTVRNQRDRLEIIDEVVLEGIDAPETSARPVGNSRKKLHRLPVGVIEGHSIYLAGPWLLCCDARVRSDPR
jgi:hypothetical protein